MKNEEEHKYDDIIDLPRPVSSRHPRMPLLDRAAQFSAFAALTGHEEAIQETARLTSAFIELDEDRKAQLDEELLMLHEAQSRKMEEGHSPEITVTYYRADSRKSGGAYVTVRGRVKKVDTYRHQLCFVDGTILPIENIFSIESSFSAESNPFMGEDSL